YCNAAGTCVVNRDRGGTGIGQGHQELSRNLSAIGLRDAKVRDRKEGIIIENGGNPLGIGKARIRSTEEVQCEVLISFVQDVAVYGDGNSPASLSRIEDQDRATRRTVIT